MCDDSRITRALESIDRHLRCHSKGGVTYTTSMLKEFKEILSEEPKALTLAELRRRTGEPVWLSFPDNHNPSWSDGWHICGFNGIYNDNGELLQNFLSTKYGYGVKVEEYGTVCLAFDRPPTRQEVE